MSGRRDSGRGSLGVQLSGLVPAYAPDLSAALEVFAELEHAGVTDLVYGEHLVYSAQMIHPTGRPLGRSSRTSYIGDVLVWFGAAAARTSKLRLWTSIVLAALHEPALLAKQIATLDVLSGGRLVLGVGSGWNRAEFEAVGVPFGERFARMEEVVAACRALWTQDSASFHGKYVHFDDVVSEPAPTSARMPVWWAGRATEAMARRVVAEEGGWIVSEAATQADILRGVDLIGAQCARTGLDATRIGVRATLPGPPRSVLRASFEARVEHAQQATDRLHRLGVTQTTVPLTSYAADRDGGLDFVAALART